jgi:hypothetical protein
MQWPEATAGAQIAASRSRLLCQSQICPFQPGEPDGMMQSPEQIDAAPVHAAIVVKR